MRHARRAIKIFRRKRWRLRPRSVSLSRQVPGIRIGRSTTLSLARITIAPRIRGVIKGLVGASTRSRKRRVSFLTWLPEAFHEDTCSPEVNSGRPASLNGSCAIPLLRFVYPSAKSAGQRDARAEYRSSVSQVGQRSCISFFSIFLSHTRLNRTLSEFRTNV